MGQAHNMDASKSVIVAKSNIHMTWSGDQIQVLIPAAQVLKMEALAKKAHTIQSTQDVSL